MHKHREAEKSQMVGLNENRSRNRSQRRNEA